MIAGTRLIKSSDDPDAFARLRTAAADWPHFLSVHYTDPGRRYFAATTEAFDDRSFALARGDRPVLLVECDVLGDAVGRFGGPLEFRFSPDSDYAERRADLNKALAELRAIALARGAARIRFRTCEAVDPDGLVASRALALAAAPGLEIRAQVDLTMSEEQILADLRTTHRQQLKWGRENLTVDAVTRQNPDRRKFEDFREFHARIAGRVTRPSASWDAMYAWIEAGVGELVYGDHYGKTLGASLSLDAMGTTTYFSAVYDREYFRFPLSHYLVYSMILRARRRGMRRFDLGVVRDSNEAATDKEIAIARFKHGFTNRSVGSVVWTLQVQG